MSEKLILSYLMQENRPDDWDNMFFATATLWSRKSHDSETQCGCVLVKNKTIIATGYNGLLEVLTTMPCLLLDQKNTHL